MAKKKTDVNQSKAMRDTLGVLGMDAKREDVEAYLTENYHFTPKHYYVLRSNARNAILGKSDNAAAEKKPSAQSSTANSGTETLTLLQQLANRVGGMKELAKIVEKLK